MTQQQYPTTAVFLVKPDLLRWSILPRSYLLWSTFHRMAEFHFSRTGLPIVSSPYFYYSGFLIKSSITFTNEIIRGGIVSY